MSGPSSVQSNFIRANTFSYSPAVDVPPNDAPGEIVPAEPGGAARTSKDDTFVRQDVEKMLLKPGSGHERSSEAFVSNHRVAPLASGERELLKQLRDIGAETWATVGKNDIKDISQKLQKVVGESKWPDVENRLDEVKATVRLVEKCFMDLGGYKASDMALALKRCTDWDGAVAKIEDEKQLKGQLMEQLAQLVKPTSEDRRMAAVFDSAVTSLADIAQTLRELGEGLELSDELRMQIDDLILNCDARVSELSTLEVRLVNEMGEGGSQNLVDLVKDMSGTMHGNYDAVVHDSPSVLSAFEALDRITARLENDLVPPGDLQLLREQLDAADKYLKDGAASKLSEKMDPKVCEKLLTKLAEMRERIDGCEKAAVRKTRLAFVHSFPFKIFTLFKNVLSRLPETKLADFPTLRLMESKHRGYIAALEKYVRDGANPEKAADLRKAEADYAAVLWPPPEEGDDGEVVLPTLKALSKELEAFQKLSGFSGEANVGDLRDKFDTFDGLISEIQEQVEKRKIGEGEAKSLFLSSIFGGTVDDAGSFFDACRDQIETIGTGPKPGAFLVGDVKKALAGNEDFSDLLLASMYDVSTEWLDPDLKDENLKASWGFGAGGVSSVTKLDYRIPDGKGGVRSKSIVFKPDFFATLGNTWVCFNQNAFGRRQQALKLNIASYAIADWLGCGNRVTKTMAMFHEGKLGIGMTLAHGWSAVEFDEKRTDGVKNLLESHDPAERQKGLGIVNDILEQTTDLQWLDLLSGQGDRHGENYHIGIDTETGHATVTGIDNDLCMPKYRTGLTTVRLTESERENIRESLENAVRDNVISQNDVDDLMANGFGRHGEFDFSRKDASPLLAYLVSELKGMQSIAVPKVMSQTMHKKLMGIATDATGAKRKEFIAKMAGLLPKDNVDAFAMRLDELLALVKSGKLTVVPAATEGNPVPWLSPEVLPKMRGYKPCDDVLRLRVRELKSDLAMRDLKELMDAPILQKMINSSKVKPKKGGS